MYMCMLAGAGLRVICCSAAIVCLALRIGHTCQHRRKEQYVCTVVEACSDA